MLRIVRQSKKNSPDCGKRKSEEKGVTSGKAEPFFSGNGEGNGGDGGKRSLAYAGGWKL